MNKLSTCVLLILVLGLSIPSESSAQCGRVRSVVKNTSAKVIWAAGSAAVTAKGVVISNVQLAKSCCNRVLDTVPGGVVRRVVLQRDGKTVLLAGRRIGCVCRHRSNVAGPLPSSVDTGKRGCIRACGANQATVASSPLIANPSMRSVLQRDLECTSGTCVK